MHVALYIYASLLSLAQVSQAKDCEKAGFIFAIDLNHKPGEKDCQQTCTRAETWFRKGAEAYLDNSKRQITCQAASGVCIALKAVTNPAVSSIPQEDNPAGMKQCTCKLAIFFPRWIKDQKTQNQMDCSDLGQDGTAGPELIVQWNLEHGEHWYHIDSFSEGDVDCGSDKNECNCIPKKHGGKEDNFDTCWGQAKSFDIKFPKATKS